jgi:outer-membrane receptor for ferric coprogen and ferric-rhodotorulic acid
MSIKAKVVCVFGSAVAMTVPQFGSAAESGVSIVEEIIIKSIRDDRESRGATGLQLSVYETPQSLTILDAQQIADFALMDINSMLEMTTGVNVEPVETDRTYYNSRGFDITSMHFDGIGVPFGELFVGDLDTALYEKVEVIRGSNGLITGLGNPSGTVNYVRKRPGNEFAMSTRLQSGRWGEQRVVADISTPLGQSGRWAMRAVGVYQDNESWLDHYGNNRTAGSFIVDGQVGEAVTLALGYSRQHNDSDGVLWGAVPIIFSNGVQADYDVSTTTAMDWSYWNTLSETAFLEIGWQISDGIDVTSTLTKTDYEENSELFYAYWNTGLDIESGLGMNGYPGKYDETGETQIWDTVLHSAFTAFDREHQFNLGLSLADREANTMDSAGLSGFDVMPAFPGWQGNEVARPIWGDPYRAAEDDMSLNRLYGSLLLSISDQANLVLGVSKVDYENSGVSWGVSTDSSEDGGSPYLGFTWEAADSLNLYASYSDIYQPQYYLDANQQALGSAEGKSYELGLKKQLHAGFLATVALFKTEQENLQEFQGYSDGDGVDDTDYSDDFNFAVYRGIDVEAKGIELELAGYFTEEIRVQAGFTHLDLEDPSGDDARTFIPRNTFKFLASYSPSRLPKLNLGLSARWQDDSYFDSSFGRIEQADYALFGGYVSYSISDSLSLSLNLDNITDEKYLASLQNEQSYYAEPQNFRLSVVWDY